MDTGLEWRILRRAPWPELALAVAALLLSGLGAEVYLRRFHPLDATIYRLHPRYLHALIPGGRKLFVHRPGNGGKVLVSVNSSGFRGPELAREKRRPRAVVYGDSFVAAEFSPVEHSFVGRLGAQLADALGTPVEMVNAGVPGYGPDQAALRIEDEIGPLAPDLIVVAVFAGNDFGDLVRNKLFRLDAEAHLVVNAWTLAPQLEREFSRAERLLHQSMLWRGLRSLAAPETGRSTRTTRLLPEGGFSLLMEKRQREFLEYAGGADNEVRQLLGDPYDADLSLAPGSDSARGKRELMEGVLARIAATAGARRVPVLFVFVPSAFDVCDGWQERVDARVFPAYRRDALTSALAEIAERRGLRYVNLYPPFREAGADSLYYRGDEHWNDAGQALAADLTGALVISNGWLRKP